jgi:hypothetical protein
MKTIELLIKELNDEELKLIEECNDRLGYLSQNPYDGSSITSIKKSSDYITVQHEDILNNIDRLDMIQLERDSAELTLEVMQRKLRS